MTFTNINVRTKLMVLVLLPVVLALVMVGLLTYNVTRETLQEQVQSSLKTQAKNHAQELEIPMREGETIVSDLVDLLRAKQLTPTEQIAIQTNINQTHPEFLDSYVGYEDGNRVFGSGWNPPSDYDARKRPWYIGAIASSGITYSEPYIDARTKKTVITISRKLVVGNKTTGVVGADIELSKIQAAVGGIKVGNSGFAYLVDGRGNFLYHPTYSLTENLYTVQNGAYKQLGETIEEPKLIEGISIDGQEKALVAVPVAQTGWKLIIEAPVNELFATIKDLNKRILGIYAVTLLLLTALILYVANSIVKPIGKTVQEIERVAAGDLTLNGDSDLTAGKEFTLLKKTIDAMANKLRELVTQINQSAGELALSAQELMEGASQSVITVNHVNDSVMIIANGAASQSDAVNNANRVIDKMVQDIHQVGNMATVFGSLTGKAVQVTQKGGQVVSTTVEKMLEIEETVLRSGKVVMNLGKRSQEIGGIVDSISTISTQTNLLALNAAIEAARAGEQGRGFAIVAEEVRKLAEQSQEAATQIAQLIKEIQQETLLAVDAMNEGIVVVKSGVAVAEATGREFREVEQISEQINEQMGQLAASVDNLVSGTRQIKEVMKKVHQISGDATSQTQTVAATTEELVAMGDEVKESSKRLTQLASEMQDTISWFRI
ncbi:methyl-accepting chemotaxis protein [Heliobacterium chlorum]|uniref:Methyl-accepting chemotaxis protein n=1 Tax=Heliobacterium chlorum TaxID=2698 RepID=A0ABR7T4X8_HELCL|nr:methyl-accepting chemotaxis protein [Heliobacterium chlorum]MBC9784611.1 methyl-accepting chemotaxis protein [Heliobacterium chlorum]